MEFYFPGFANAGRCKPFMRPYIFILLFCSTQVVLGQSNFYLKDRLLTFRDEECKTSEEKSVVDSFLNHRQSLYLLNQLDTSKATRIRIQEIYDYGKQKYTCIEDYFYDTLGFVGYYDKEIYFSCNIRPVWREQQFHTAKNKVAYFNPSPVTYFPGCGQAKHPRNENRVIKKLRQKALVADSAKETFFVLNTFIDKKLKTVNYELYIPRLGKRQFCTDIWCIVETNSKLWN